MPTLDQLASLIALALTLVGYGSYYWSIFNGQTRPHFFTWFNWTLMGVVVSYAQFLLGAGYATAVTGLVTLLTGGLALLSLRYGDMDITRSDWLSFVGALALIPVWVITDEPIAAVILSIIIYTASFYPTLRKSWHKPWSENNGIYILSGIRDGFTLLAVPPGAAMALVYPAYMIITNLGFAGYLVWRRRVLSHFKPV